MRTAFIKTLTELARKNKDIFLLTGDMGFSVFENFKAEFPGRFFNIGVAEANMAGIAAGLALSGKTVFIYSIVPFVTMRCFEQIRNDICYQDLNVRIIGVGGGFAYGSAGATHYAFEDIAIMRSLFNMTVVCPGDPLETELSIRASLAYKGPLYLRIGKGNDPQVHKEIKNFRIGRGIVINEGGDIVLLATGSMLKVACEVTEYLRQRNFSVCLISMHTLKPMDKNLILKVTRQTKAIFTLEEHSIIGGLGSAVSEVLAEEKAEVYFERIGLQDNYPVALGNPEYLRHKYGLSAEAIQKKIMQILKKG